MLHLLVLLWLYVPLHAAVGSATAQPQPAPVALAAPQEAHAGAVNASEGP